MRRPKLVAAFAAIYLIWGSTYVAIDVALESFPPFMLAAIRFSFAGVVLYAITRWRGAPAPNGRQWRRAALVGALMCGSNAMVCWSQLEVASGSAALFIATVPLFIAVLEKLFVHTTIAWAPVAVGVLGGLAGIAVLVVAGNGDEPVHLGAAVVLLLSALAWSVGSLLAARGRSLQATGMMTAMEMLVGSVFLWVVASFQGESVASSTVSGRSLVALLYLTVFGSMVALNAYMWLLRNVSLVQASTYAYVNPLVAVLLGSMLLSERVGLPTLVAAVLIVGGVAMVHLGKFRHASDTHSNSAVRLHG